MELLKVFAVALFAMTVLILLVLVGQQAVREGLALGPILRLLPYGVPMALQFTVPGTVLLAVTTVYGRMSASNEIVALKSVGISPFVVIRPALYLGILLSFSAVWINDLAVSWGRAGVKRVIVDSAEQIAYSMLRMQRSYVTPNLSITVKDVEGRRLIKPTVIVSAKADTPELTIAAETGEIICDPVAETLTLRFNDGFVHSPDGSIEGTHPGPFEQVLPLDDFSRKGKRVRRASEERLGAIPQRIRDEVQQIQRLEKQSAAAAALHLTLGDFARLTDLGWRQRRAAIVRVERQIHKLRTEPYRRWANGASCFCFVIVGVPMAIRRRNGDFLTSFFLCFLPILLVYYPLLAMGLDRAKAGAMPPQVVWLGNVILIGWGLWLLRRV